jgi:hypothetical protein
MATSYPHRIRLHGPWHLESAARADLNVGHRRRTGEDPTARRVTVPVRGDAVGVTNHTGAMIIRRRFGAPRRLDEWERVRLVQDEMPHCRSYWRLNGVALQWPDTAADDEPTCVYWPMQVDVTAILQERNELVVKIEAWTNDAESFGGAVLEIGCTAYVRRIRVRPRRVTNGWGLPTEVDLAGEDDPGPLEVYALIDGRTVGYQTVQLTGDGVTQFFALDDHVIPNGSTAQLRIDLVRGAVIWDAVEVQLTLPN